MSSLTKQTAYLSPLDQYMPRVYVSIYLVFHTPGPDPAATVRRLQTGLDRLTTHLPFLKGCITVPTNDTDNGNNTQNRMAIMYSPTDTRIVLHPLPAIGISSPAGPVTPSYAQLKAENAPLRYFVNTFPVLLDARRTANPGPGDPVFAAGYSLVEGGIVLGLAAHHGLVDGTGLGGLISTWGACTRGENLSAGLRGDEVSRRAELLWEGVSSSNRGGAPKGKGGGFEEVLRRLPEFYVPETVAQPKGPVPKGATHLFVFDVSKLEAARERLKDVGGKGLDIKALSTNNILSAIVWGCITKVRMARLGGDLGNKTSKLGFAINGRRQLGPSFTERPYLGNVNLFGLPEVDISTLADIGTTCRAEALIPVIEVIYEAIKRVTVEHIGEVLSLMEQAPDTLKVQPNWVRSHGSDLSVTSWANMDVYESDFGPGIGRPEFMRPPFFDSDGLVIILPRKRRSGEKGPSSEDKRGVVETIEVVTVLNVDDIAALEKDEVWRSWLA